VGIQSDYWRGGDWNAYCARCGEKAKASQLIKEWQGYFVCRSCHEPRQPQDFVRSIREFPDVPWVQNPDPQYLSDYVTFYNNKNVFVGLVNNRDQTINFFTTEDVG